MFRADTMLQYNRGAGDGGGARENSKHADPSPPMINGKQKAIVAKASTECAFPFFALESFHVALEGIGFQLDDEASDASLNGLR